MYTPKTVISGDVATCFFSNTHKPHWWAYTSSGGGHMLRLPLTDEDRWVEKNVKSWLCPGNKE